MPASVSKRTSYNAIERSARHRRGTPQSPGRSRLPAGRRRSASAAPEARSGRALPGAQLRLVGALGRLVGLQRLRRVHVPERREARHRAAAPRRRRSAWRASSRERSPHVSEPRELSDPALEIAGVGGAVPDLRGVAAILRGRDDARAPVRASPCSRGTDGRPASRGTPPRAGGVKPRDVSCVEAAEPLFSLSGPVNAVCTVTCWSSAKPISSASGSRAMSASASGSPVKWSATGVVAMTRS